MVNIPNLVRINKDANHNIALLEEMLLSFKINSDKDRANFSNITIALHGYRMISNASECILINEDVLKDEEGNFYIKFSDAEVQEVNKPEVPESTKGKICDCENKGEE